MSFVNSLITLYGYLTGQGPNKDIRFYCKNISNLKSLMFIILVVIWLISSLILSLAFNGLLLNTFFFTKYTPVVNTLQDIRDNKHLYIDGHYQQLSDTGLMNNFPIDDIIARMKKDKYEYFHNITKSIELIINGKGVAFFTTIFRRIFMSLAGFYNDRIIVSENKYLPDYLSFFVLRSQKFSKLMVF